MSDLSDKISELLSDEDGRKKLFDIASGLRGGPVSESGEKLGEPASGESDLFSRIPSLLSSFSGTENKIDEKKLNLIKAIQPYMSEYRKEYIDRAVRMASIAKAAKDTLGILGR